MQRIGLEAVIAGFGQFMSQTNDIDKAAADLGGSMDNAAKKSDGLGGALQNLGGIAGKALVAGAVLGAAALVALGAAAFRLGSDFDAAYDAIRIGTGATGEALQGLKDDFKAVAADVPADFGTVSAVIADLNTRTGLTGEALQGLGKQLVEVSRITKTDASQNVRLATRLFGDWAIATEDQAGTLDKLFRTSQATGIGITDLQTKVVQFGAPLRQMGFSFEESIAMLGKWEKEGVNTELVLGSMRIALGKFAKDNIPVQKGLADTVAAIKAAGDASAANAIAMEIFGARAGPDMAAAIREGRFEYADLIKVIESGGDTILGVAKETEDFGEKWQRLLNRASIAVEPLASAVFDLAGKVLDKLTPALDKALSLLAPMATAMANRLAPAIATAAAVIGPMVKVTEGLVAAFTGLGDIDSLQIGLQQLFGEENNEAIGKVMAAIFDLSAIVNENLTPILIGLATAIAIVVVPAFIAWAAAAGAAAVATITALAPVVLPILAIAAAVGLLAAAWQNNWGDIQGRAMAAWAAIEPILQAVFDKLAIFWKEIEPNVMKVWATIQLGTQIAMKVIGDVVKAALTFMAQFWNDNWQSIAKVLSGVWLVMQGVVEVAWSVISGIIKVGLAVLAGDWSGAWQAIKDTYKGVWDGIQNITSGAWSILQGYFDLAIAALKIAWEGLWANVQTVVNTAWENLKAAWREWPGALTQLGRDMVQGILDGLGGLYGALLDALWGAISGVLDDLKRRLGIASPSKLMAGIAANMMDGFTVGIDESVRDVQASMARAVAAITLPAVSMSFQQSVPVLSPSFAAAQGRAGGSVQNNYNYSPTINGAASDAEPMSFSHMMAWVKR